MHPRLLDLVVTTATDVTECDCGIVMLVEEDRHDELMERSGLYAEMYNRQFRMADVWPSDDSMGPGIGGG